MYKTFINNFEKKKQTIKGIGMKNKMDFKIF